ncbi:MAG: AraC family transcriptional regulator [Pseudomonadota bacterium]
MELPYRAGEPQRHPALRLWETRAVDVAAIAFWISIASFLVSTAFDLGILGVFVGMAGTAACGFSWLLARAVFRSDAGHEIWPLALVGVLVSTGLLLTLSGDARSGSGPVAIGLGMALSLHGLLSSTVLLLALVEAWLGYRDDLPDREKRFRLAFALAYGAMLATSVIWLGAAPEGSWADRSGDTIRMICAGLAVVLSVWAWRFRKQHAFPKTRRRQRSAVSVSDEEAVLASLILKQLTQHRIFLEPDLKLSDLATRLGEADYKVRNAITGALGFRNFNNMINHFRVETAKDALIAADTAQRSILTIALDCGFSSIGPFNRAFKLETGQTPSAFRDEMLGKLSTSNP